MAGQDEQHPQTKAMACSEPFHLTENQVPHGPARRPASLYQQATVNSRPGDWLRLLPNPGRGPRHQEQRQRLHTKTVTEISFQAVLVKPKAISRTLVCLLAMLCCMLHESYAFPDCSVAHVAWSNEAQ